MNIFIKVVFKTHMVFIFLNSTTQKLFMIYIPNV